LIWQISTGGPGDQFEFEVDPEDYEVQTITYRFLDWFDGASVELHGRDYDTLADWYECNIRDFVSCV
jgi:hypothetical protein